jgi:hypothetical protein
VEGLASALLPAVVTAKACIAALVGALAAASPAPAAVPRDVHAGVRVRVAGTMTRPKTVAAEGVEIVAGAGGADGVKAVIEAVDPEAKTLTALGIKVVASDATVLQGGVSFSAIRPGQRVSAKGTFRSDATLIASKLRVRPEKPEKAREVALEGTVQKVDSGSTSFAVLGLTVVLTPQTKIERGGRGGEGPAGSVVMDRPRGEAPPPSIPSYGVIWEGRLTRSGAPRDEAGWTWLRNRGVRSVVNFRMLPADEQAFERARFEHYLSVPFEGKGPATDAEAETFLAFVRDQNHWPVHIHCKEGKYRTGLMAALVRYAIDGWSIDEALAEARRYTGGKDLSAPGVAWLRRWAAHHKPGSHALSRGEGVSGFSPTLRFRD